MKKNKNLMYFLILAMTIFVSACGNEAKGEQEVSASEENLIFAAETEFDTLNPILEETNLNSLLFRGLMKFDENNLPVTDIAESVEISEDETVYQFKIREDIKFHDSKPLTVDDIIFTINSILKDDNASYLKTDFNAVDKISKIDDYNFEIKLKYPFSPLLDKLTVPILPEHAFKEEGMRTSNFNSRPIGTGPYKLEEWQRGSHITLKVNENFHGTSPSIEEVIFKFIPDSNARALQLKSGEVDVASLTPAQAGGMQQAEDINVNFIDTADYRGILYNMNHPILKDLDVRKAFNYAVDRAGIVNGVLNGYGTAAYSPLQKHDFANDSVEKYSYDIKRAEQLLDEANWKKESDGYRYKDDKKLAFTITAPVTDTVRVNIANYVAEAYKQIGADVTVDALDWNTISIEDTEAFIIAWGSPSDADNHTHVLFHSNQTSRNSAGYNYGNYSNAEVDQLLEEGRTYTDENERKRVYMELQKELAEDPPYNFLVYMDAIYGTNPQLSGFSERTLGHHGSGFLWNIEEWEWNDR